MSTYMSTTSFQLNFSSTAATQQFDIACTVKTSSTKSSMSKSIHQFGDINSADLACTFTTVGVHYTISPDLMTAMDLAQAPSFLLTTQLITNKQVQELDIRVYTPASCSKRLAVELFNGSNIVSRPML